MIAKIVNKFKRYKTKKFPTYHSKVLQRLVIDYRLKQPPWWLNFTLDEQGIPVTNYQNQGQHINPTFVAYRAFQLLGDYEFKSELLARKKFLNCANWFCNNSTQVCDDSICWLNHFDWSVGKAHCKAPFADAMTQSLALSVLVAAYQISGDKKYFENAKYALSMFLVKNHELSFVTFDSNGDGPFYEEYPAKPYPRILDGLLISLIGPADFLKIALDHKVKEDILLSVSAIGNKLHRYSFMGCWSYFGGENYSELSDGYYHGYNIQLLKICYLIYGDKVFFDLHRQFEDSSESKITKFLIPFSSTFVAYKNLFKEKLSVKKNI